MGYLPAGSRHQGGCHVLMADGAVKFITDSIEAGSQNAFPVFAGGNRTIAADGYTNSPGSKSPYGIWGAIGTRGSKETEGIDTRL